MPLGMKLMLVLWSPLAALPLVLVLARVPVPQPLPYAWHKALHIVGAVMFVGNIWTQGLWLVAARMTGSAAAIRAGFRALNWTDLVFMGPGMFLLIANGAVLSQAWGGIERWSWMIAALGLFGLYGVAAGPLMYIQVRTYRILGAASDDKLAPELDALNQGKGLGVWMSLMVAVPIAILILMVVKPRLW